jgi:hypothetical protein
LGSIVDFRWPIEASTPFAKNRRIGFDRAAFVIAGPSSCVRRIGFDRADLSLEGTSRRPSDWVRSRGFVVSAQAML